MASLTKRRNDGDSDSDVDGAPLRSDSYPTTPSSSSNATDKSKLPAGFVPSKWETIEPEEVQAQVRARHSCLFGFHVIITKMLSKPINEMIYFFLIL